MITQRRERLPALRAAVSPAREVPGHLESRQVRVIPPPRPRPRPPLNALLPVPARPAVLARAAGRRPRPRLLRRPAEHQPLQHREVSPQPLRLGVPLRIPRSQPRDLLAQQRVLLAQRRVSRRMLPVRLQRGSQRLLQRPSIPRIQDHASRNRHAPQQTPSALANHAPHTSVSLPTSTWRQTATSQDFRVLTEELLDSTRFDNQEAIEDHLLDKFVPAVYKARPPAPGDRPRMRVDPRDADRWLRFLARSLSRESAVVRRRLFTGDQTDIAWWRVYQAVAPLANSMILWKFIMKYRRVGNRYRRLSMVHKEGRADGSWSRD
jgi:hypothetical protein